MGIQAKSPASLLDATSGEKHSTREQAELFVMRSRGVYLKKNSPEVYERLVKETAEQLDADYKKAQSWL